VPAGTHSTISSSIKRLALRDADSVLKGANPAAIRSALMNRGVCDQRYKKLVTKSLTEFLETESTTLWKWLPYFRNNYQELFQLVPFTH